MKQAKGKVIQIIGPVVDVRFEAEELPNIYDAVHINHNGKTLVLEVAQHIGDNRVRCIGMSSTEGLVRGVEAVSTGAPISVPVGNNTLGRLINVVGEAIDNKEAIKDAELWPIHRDPPIFEDLETAIYPQDHGS